MGLRIQYCLICMITFKHSNLSRTVYGCVEKMTPLTSYLRLYLLLLFYFADLVRYVTCCYLMLVCVAKGQEVLQSTKVMDMRLLSDVSFTMILSVEAMKQVIDE